MLRAPLLLVAAACAALACTGRCAGWKTTAGTPPPRLVATVEEGDAVRILHLGEDGWRLFRALPSRARAIRISRDGRHVAWVLDLLRGSEPVSTGFVWRDGAAKAESLGILGMRKREAPGLAVGDGGRVAYVDEAGHLKLREPGAPERDLGEGAEPVFGAGSKLAHLGARGACIRTPPPLPEVCGELLKPLAIDGDTVYAQSEQRLAIVGPGREEYHPVLQLLAARPGPHGVLLLRLEQLRERTVDELVLLRDGKQRMLLQTMVLTSAEWDRDGSVLLVRSPTRRSLIDLMLAHAPEEFGGAASIGEAVRLDLATGRETPVEGLVGRRVRGLFAPVAVPPPDAE